jgi:hypothetical protein
MLTTAKRTTTTNSLTDEFSEMAENKYKSIEIIIAIMHPCWH